MLYSDVTFYISVPQTIPVLVITTTEEDNILFRVYINVSQWCFDTNISCLGSVVIVYTTYYTD